MKHGKTLQELAIEIVRQNSTKEDFIVDTKALTMDFNNSDEALGLNFAGKHFPIKNTAHEQIAEKLKIPQRYYDRMMIEQPGLLRENVNTWFNSEPSRKMVRTLDGEARAFLSDKYRRIDNFEILSEVFPIIADMKGAEVKSCEITDDRMYLKVVNPRIETEVVKGDIVQSGLIISNSEVGRGSVSVQPLIYRLVCSNGMIAADAGIRKFHIGRINETNDDYSIFKSDTIVADEKAFMLKLRDTIKAATDITNFNKIVAQMQSSAKEKITSTDIPEVVKLTAKDYNIRDAEQNGILDHLIRGGDLSLYGLANAVTRHAQDVESYDRSTELETIAYSIMIMPPKNWHKINNAS